MPRDPAPIPPALRPAVPPPIARLALRPREAAESLGVCERTLRDLPDVPRLKLNGGTVLYPVRELERWLADRLDRGPEADAPTVPAGVPTSGGDVGEL
jgi:hypothetical protein